MLIGLIIATAFLIYSSVAFGFLTMTYNVPSLKLARKIYWYVPYITIRLTLLVVWELICERNFKKAIALMFLGNKMTIVGLSMVRVATEVAQKKSKNPAAVIKCFKYMRYTKKKEPIYKEYSRYTKACLA